MKLLLLDNSYLQLILMEENFYFVSFQNEYSLACRKNEEDMTEPFIRSTILTSMLLFLTYEEKEEKLKELLGNLNTNLDGKIDMDLVNKYIIPCFYDWQNQNAKKKVLYIQLKKV